MEHRTDITYHLIQSERDEWLTTSDSVAEMALSEGLDTFLDLDPETIDELLDFHETWTDVRIIT